MSDCERCGQCRAAAGQCRGSEFTSRHSASGAQRKREKLVHAPRFRTGARGAAFPAAENTRAIIAESPSSSGLVWRQLPLQATRTGLLRSDSNREMAAEPMETDAAAAAAASGGADGSAASVFDVDAYIGAYEGDTKLKRLEFIAKKVSAATPPRRDGPPSLPPHRPPPSRAAPRSGCRCAGYRQRSSATLRRSCRRAASCTTSRSRAPTRTSTAQSVHRCACPALHTLARTHAVREAGARAFG